MGRRFINHPNGRPMALAHALDVEAVGPGPIRFSTWPRPGIILGCDAAQRLSAIRADSLRSSSSRRAHCVRTAPCLGRSRSWAFCRQNIGALRGPKHQRLFPSAVLLLDRHWQSPTSRRQLWRRAPIFLPSTREWSSVCVISSSYPNSAFYDFELLRLPKALA